MPDLTRSTSFVSDVRGEPQPRIYTPPLVEGEPGPCGCGCALTEETSYGFDVIAFARDVVGQPLDPWQEWIVIHAGELLPDGRPRFRKVLIVVARQQGKTHLCKILSLYWLFVEKRELVFGTSTTLDNAKDAWKMSVELAEESEWLKPEIKNVRQANGEQSLETTSGCEYKIGPANRKGGRGKTIHRLILDELREHQNWDAWDASTKATNAVLDAQIFAITNMGDDKSVVLDDCLAQTRGFIERGEGDYRFGLFEYSAPDKMAPDDPAALAMANPNAGHRTDMEMLVAEAQAAIRSGAEVLARFRTEILCQRVKLVDPAIDPDRWDDSGTRTPIKMNAHRDRVALGFDVSLDNSNCTLVAAAEIDGLIHCEVIKSWAGYDCTLRAKSELADLVEKIRPKAFGWFPGGPAAALAAQLRERKRGERWPPRGVKPAEIQGDVAAACMGLAEVVRSGQLRHPESPLLTQHVLSAQKLSRGDTWVFQRKGASTIDAAYALAAAVQLARTIGPPRAPLKAV